jgi:hypothetical protein
VEGAMGRYRKGPRKLLEVIYEAGPVPGRSATEVYAETLRIIGFDRVAKEPLTLSGEPLVSRDRPCRAFRQFGEWYVATHSDTAEKHSVLVRLKQRLGLGEMDVRLTELTEQLLS